MIALAGRSASRFGDEVALVALTLRLQASGAHPYEVALLLAAGLVPFVLLARVAGRLADSADSRRVLVCATVAQACQLMRALRDGARDGPGRAQKTGRSGGDRLAWFLFAASSVARTPTDHHNGRGRSASGPETSPQHHANVS